MKDLIDFLTALAAGKFDPNLLYTSGWPYLYEIDSSNGKIRKELEAEGIKSFPDGSSTLLKVGISPEFYGTGLSYVPKSRSDTLLERIFSTEKIDLHALEKEFENLMFSAEKGCSPLVKELIEKGRLVSGISGSGSFIVSVNPREDDTPPGYAELEYTKQDKKPGEQPVPLFSGSLVPSL